MMFLARGEGRGSEAGSQALIAVYGGFEVLGFHAIFLRQSLGYAHPLPEI